MTYATWIFEGPSSSPSVFSVIVK